MCTNINMHNVTLCTPSSMHLLIQSSIKEVKFNKVNEDYVSSVKVVLITNKSTGQSQQRHEASDTEIGFSGRSYLMVA